LALYTKQTKEQKALNMRKYCFYNGFHVLVGDDFPDVNFQQQAEIAKAAKQPFPNSGLIYDFDKRKRRTV